MRFEKALVCAMIALSVPAHAASITGIANPDASGQVHIDLMPVVMNAAKYTLIFNYGGNNLLAGTMDAWIYEEFDYFDLVRNRFAGGETLEYYLNCSITSPCSDGPILSITPRRNGFRAIIDSAVIERFETPYLYEAFRYHTAAFLSLSFGSDAPVHYSISTSPLQSIPEPTTWAMLLLGFGAVGTALRRRTAQTLPVITPSHPNAERI